MNVENRFRGVRDVPLSEIGRAEAWQTANSVTRTGIAVVYTSPLGRAREVADAIVSSCELPAACELDDLLNLDYGRWEGLTREECSHADPAEWALYVEDPEQAVCPGGESVAAAADRILAALRTIGSAHGGETVAAVSHGVMLRLAVLRVAGPSEHDWQFDIPTGSGLSFDVEGGKITLVSTLDRSVPKGDPTARLVLAG
jgi:broad specificity phosphatase PhoE